MSRSKQSLILTSGDPNGIGPEIILRLHAKKFLRQFNFLITSHKDIFDQYSHALKLPELEEKYFVNGSTKSGFKIAPGKTSRKAGELSAESIFYAITISKQNENTPFITLPISKESLNLAGIKYLGHTELLKDKYDVKDVAMILYSNYFIVSPLTGHIPISKISKAITKDLIQNMVNLIYKSLISDFGFQSPKIAMLGLNPHNGDGGVIGSEEVDVIIPAIKSLRDSGIEIEGPFPADGFFAAKQQEKYNLVVSCYHDQGLIPFKMLHSKNGVNFTAGLPVIRTSPDHGTAFNIAGKGLADISSTKAAINLAMKITRNRND